MTHRPVPARRPDWAAAAGSPPPAYRRWPVPSRLPRLCLFVTAATDGAESPPLLFAVSHLPTFSRREVGRGSVALLHSEDRADGARAEPVRDSRIAGPVPFGRVRDCRLPPFADDRRIRAGAAPTRVRQKRC